MEAITSTLLPLSTKLKSKCV